MLETLHFLSFFLLTIFWPKSLYPTASYFVSSHWHVDRSSEGWESFFYSHIMRFLSFIFLLIELEKENLYIRNENDYDLCSLLNATLAAKFWEHLLLMCANSLPKFALFPYSIFYSYYGNELSEGIFYNCMPYLVKLIYVMATI